MSRILIGVTGGIAAYKSLELARLATKAGHGVRVLMTPTAERFVGKASFEGIVGAPVLINEFDSDQMSGSFPGEPRPEHDPIGHLALAQRADAYLIAPASANTVAKLAAGICDSMVTTAFLASTAPRLVAPAMNDRMYRDPATQENLETLRNRGVTVIEPDSGQLASRGEHGIGRLPDPQRLLAEVEAAIPANARPWDGLKVLISAGGTREPLDPVRFLGNRSSGKMGFALAAAAARRGAEVSVVAANVALPTPAGVHRIDVETAGQLAAACQAEFGSAHVLLMSAAVADFKPSSAADGKLVREGAGFDLALEPTPDVLAGLASKRHPGQTLVGFAAEHGGEFVERARAKLERKGLDAVVVNDVSDQEIGFDSDQNQVTFVEPEAEVAIPRAGKAEIAEAILDQINRLRATAEAEVS